MIWNHFTISWLLFLHFLVYMAIGFAADNRSFIVAPVCDWSICGWRRRRYKSLEHFARSHWRWRPVQMRSQQFDGHHRILSTTQCLWWVCIKIHTVAILLVRCEQKDKLKPFGGDSFLFANELSPKTVFVLIKHCRCPKYYSQCFSMLRWKFGDSTTKVLLSFQISQLEKLLHEDLYVISITAPGPMRKSTGKMLALVSASDYRQDMCAGIWIGGRIGKSEIGFFDVALHSEKKLTNSHVSAFDTKSMLN